MIKMGHTDFHSWTFSGLVGAFFDLWIAYLLLCISTAAFFALKILGVFGLCLPYPCNGLFGIRKMFVNCPSDKVSYVQMSVRGKFPFDTIWSKDPSFESNLKPFLKNEVSDGVGGCLVESEGEGSCSLLQSNVKSSSDSEVSNMDVISKHVGLKGKNVINSRQRLGPRWHRKNSIDKEKPSLFTACGEFPEIMEASWSSVNDIRYEANEEMLARVTHESDDLHYKHENSALCLELDKERSAAASAVQEAMAMIFRLQEEKASIEMSAIQYKRMIEEKIYYDAEEMDILKEIILRIETEKHFLKEEVETYRQMFSVNEQGFQDKDVYMDSISESYEHNFLEKHSSTVRDEHGQIDKCFLNSGEIQEKHRNDDSQKPIVDIEPLVHDVHVIHVIDDGYCPSNSACIDHNEQISTDAMLKISKDCDISSENFEFEKPNASDMASEFPLGKLQQKEIMLGDEKQKIDSKIEWLKDRLRIVQEEKKKLNLCVGQGEVHLRPLEDIENALHEILKIAEAEKVGRWVSLPPPSSKVVSKKRRCRSVPLGQQDNV